MINNTGLNGKACSVEKYIKSKGRYKIVLEETKEVFGAKPQQLKRRDRTSNDCGYYIELKRDVDSPIRHGYASEEQTTSYGMKSLSGVTVETDHIIRYSFASKEECQSFLKEVNADGWVAVETKGERALREN